MAKGRVSALLNIRRGGKVVYVLFVRREIAFEYNKGKGGSNVFQFWGGRRDILQYGGEGVKQEWQPVIPLRTFYFLE